MRIRATTVLLLAASSLALSGCSAAASPTPATSAAVAPSPSVTSTAAAADLPGNTSLVAVLPTLAEVQKLFTADWTQVTKATELTKSPTTVGTRSATSQCENTYVDMTTIFATATRTDYELFSPTSSSTNTIQGIVEYLLPTSKDATTAFADATKLSTICPKEPTATASEHALDTSALTFPATGFSTIGSSGSGNVSIYFASRNVFFVTTSETSDGNAEQLAALAQAKFAAAQ